MMNMKHSLVYRIILTTILLCLSVHAADMRNITTGSILPDENYADQLYVVIANNGNWVCVLTTGPGIEGDTRQHIVSTISTPGRTGKVGKWSARYSSARLTCLTATMRSDDWSSTLSMRSNFIRATRAGT